MVEGLECPKCKQTFHCGTVAGESTCWCFDLPVLENIKDINGCMCPDCLKQAIESQFAEPDKG